MKTLKTTILMLLIATSSLMASQPRKVLIIGIDGVRSDALQDANTPNIDQLIATGLYTWDAWHLGITVSGPSWSTIMTGVWHQKHGVLNNTYTGSKFNDYPYITTLAKQIKPNLKCVQVIEWPPLITNVYNDNFDNEVQTPDGDGATTADEAKTILETDADLDFLFVYLDICDITGHSSGFNPNNPSYMSAIEASDSHVGIIIDALKSRATYNDENWLVLLITDHGGQGTGHGGNSYAERHIWWIASGTAVENQQIFGPDPGSYVATYSTVTNSYVPNANATLYPTEYIGVNDSLLELSPVQADIGVTALHHLLYDDGINPEDQPQWNLDGKSWLKTISSVNDKFKEEGNAKIFPNPTTGMLTVWFENIYSDKINYTVTDLLGRTVRSEKNMMPAAANKLNIDLAGEPCGNYILKMEIGKQVITKKIMLNY